MINKPAIHTKSANDDQAAISKLSQILSQHGYVVAQINHHDTWPNIDGYLLLKDESGVEIGKLEVQVKPAKVGSSDHSSYSFGNDKFLGYCSQTHPLPVLLIAVDKNKDRAWWQYMHPDYVSKLTGRTIRFSEKNLIDRNNVSKNSYFDPWLLISQEREQAIEQFEKKKLKQSNKIEVLKLKDISDKYLDNIQFKLQTLFIDNDLKCKYYYGFIDLVEPYFFDGRGVEKRRRLRKIFNISEMQENSFVEKMIKDGYAKRVGDLLVITDKKLVRQLQNEIINKDVISFEDIATVFK